MSIEAGVVIGKDGEPLHWHTPPDRSAVTLPDSRDLWEVLWENRERLAGFAHSHPGSGVPAPSWTDITTFAAVEAGLGVRLDWWIMTETSIALYRWSGPQPNEYTLKLYHGDSPDRWLWPWAAKLRDLSGYR